MRILRVAAVPNNRTGGMSRVMHFTTDAMARAGHHVDYLWGEDLGGCAVPRLGRFVLPARLPGLVRRKQCELGAAYDVVEIHEPMTAGYCLARSLGSRLPPAVALTYGVESRGHALLLDYRRRKGLPSSLKQRYSPLSVTLQADYGLRRCSQVVCFNREDAEYLRSRGVPTARIVQTHSGVGQAFLDAGEADPVRTGNGMLFLASWLERKGTLDLVPAVSGVLRDHPASRLTVAGCGAGPEAVLASFPADLRGRVEVIPKVGSDEELLDIYRRHSVYVLPSYLEGQPLSMLEAAAMGLAIVTTNVCGMRDFVRDGENGLLVPPGRPEELGKALGLLAGDPDLRRRLGDAARAAVRPLTWEHAAQDMLTAYERAAAERRGGAR